MRIDLTGKTALVTGSTQGIGRAIAATLADAGARVAINGRRAEGVAATIEELRAESADRDLVPATGDVTNMVAYLSSPLASATTGAAVRVDDGYVDSIVP